MDTRSVMWPLICSLACVAGAQEPPGISMDVRGESLVLAAEKPANLCFDQILPGTLTLRSTFMATDEGCVVYTEGADYRVDYAAGTITRTAGSRIPDYSTHVLYGLEQFNHADFTNWSNHPFFVWADYRTSNGKPWAQPNDQRQAMAAVRAKLEAGGPFKIASYGDSITAGGEASRPEFRFQNRFASYLQRRFPNARVQVQDVSISGYASRQGIDWFDKYLGTVDKPDLVLVGWGMNDHNKGNTEPDVFRANLVELVKMIRERKGAEVILFSAFPPNDHWVHSTHRMDQYAAATREAAAESGCAYVDVFSTWEMVLKRKDQSSLLGNNINHPNDFGHWLYEQAFEAMRF